MLDELPKLHWPRWEKMNSAPNALCSKSNFHVEESKVFYKYWKRYTEPTSAHQHLSLLSLCGSSDFHVHLSATVATLQKDHLKLLPASAVRWC